jgi:hypothetical protein
MKKLTSLIAATLLGLFSSAFAAEENSEPTPEGEKVASVEGSLTPEKVEAPAAEEESKIEEEIATIKGKVDSIEEQYSETKTSVLSLQRLKMSGYVQGRFQYAENSRGGLDAAGSPRVKDQFSIRRGRLKAQYEAPWSRFVLQVDVTPKGVALKDAEAWLVEQWTKTHYSLVLGQTKWPFGHEIVQSSGEREFPERTRVVRAFAAGERDLGAKMIGKVSVFNFMGGVFNGNGTENKSFIGVDNDRNKDVVGRVGVDLFWLAAGVSGWYGETFRTPSSALKGGTFPRNRVGADAQLYLDLLPIGGTALKAEYIRGRTWFKDGVEQFGLPAHGWYVLLMQNVGLQDQVGLRYDSFDPTLGVADKVDSKDAAKPGSQNSVTTIGAAYIHHFDESLKLSVAYEVPMTAAPQGAKDPSDNMLTAQMQVKF